jgi:ribosomal protein L11 methylase PrmA
MFEEVDEFVQMITQGGHLVGPAVERTVDDEKDWVTEVQKSWPPRLIPVEDGCCVVKLPFHSDQDVAKAFKGLKGGTEGTRLIEVCVAGGGAFGTGEHPTTRMCSAWAYKVTKDLCKRGMEVELCDYGAGTGLIGLVALAAGENVRVKGVEVDHMAIVAGRKNGELNGWSRAQFEMYAPPFGAAGGELWERLTGVDAIDPIKENVERYEEENGAADIVVANILAGPLKEVRIDQEQRMVFSQYN